MWAGGARSAMNMHRATQIAYLLLRVMAAVMFMQSGGLKLFGWFGGMPPDHSTAKFMTEPWIGGVLEVAGGLALALGLFTRPVAFIVSGEMAVAYWQFHAPGGFWPIQNHGEMAVLLCFLFLFMSAFGGGDYSLDALIARKRAVRSTP